MGSALKGLHPMSVPEFLLKCPLMTGLQGFREPVTHDQYQILPRLKYTVGQPLDIKVPVGGPLHAGIGQAWWSK